MLEVFKMTTDLTGIVPMEEKNGVVNRAIALLESNTISALMKYVEQSIIERTSKTGLSNPDLASQSAIALAYHFSIQSLKTEHPSFQVLMQNHSYACMYAKEAVTLSGWAGKDVDFSKAFQILASHSDSRTMRAFTDIMVSIQKTGEALYMRNLERDALLLRVPRK